MQFDSIEQQTLPSFAEKSYLDYAMYVILDRALPHISDGLKPVQRRIVYAMSELGLKYTAKYKKSARTVGDVLGKFHPHSDTACYEAMVLMAQPFSYRYPLIDGQGNWGSTDDPKSFAAMRYTESRLTPYATTLLSELDQGTTDWQLNFDGTVNEPITLPARLPNVLLNGSSGIAVGMATDILPHNLTEVIDACLHLLDRPNADTKTLCQWIQGPDFPTKAEIITAKDEIMKAYQSGTGTIRMRSVYHIEKDNIIITALPYQISGAKILEQIAEQIRNKKLPFIDDLRDESDHENPTRLVIVAKKQTDIWQLMAHLFATTQLEHNYRLNFNMIGLNGKPEVKSLSKLLNEWLSYRLTTVKKRTHHQLEKVLARLHILDALLIAFLNIDEVIAIIRYEEYPKEQLIKQFNLTETQSEAILNLKLRNLAKLEEIKIQKEQHTLTKEKNKLQALLNSKIKLKNLVKSELKEDAKTYGRERLSPIVTRKLAVAIKAVDVLPKEAITVILSNKGWVRQAKGHEINPESLNYKSGDKLQAIAKGWSNQVAVFLDSSGRSYSLAPHTFPSARGFGEPLTGRLKPPPGVSFTAVMLDKINDEESSLHLLATTNGYGFMTRFNSLVSKNKQGKVIVNIETNSELLPPQRINDQNSSIAIATNLGYLLIFPLAELPVLSKGKGNKLINIKKPAKAGSKDQEFVIAITICSTKDDLIIISGKRRLTLTEKTKQPYYGKRGQRGRKLARGFQKINRLTVNSKE